MPRSKQPSARRRSDTTVFSGYRLCPPGQKRPYFRLLGEAYAYAGNGFLMREAFGEIGEEPSPAAKQLYATAVAPPTRTRPGTSERFLEMRARCAEHGRSVPLDDALRIYRAHLTTSFDLEDLFAVSAYLGLPLDNRTLYALMEEEETRAFPKGLRSFACNWLARRRPVRAPQSGIWEPADVFGESDWISTVTLTLTTPDEISTERRFRGGVLIFGQEDRSICMDPPTVRVLDTDATGGRKREAVLCYPSSEMVCRREDLLAAVPCSHGIELAGDLTAEDVMDLRQFFHRRCKLIALLDQALADVTAST